MDATRRFAACAVVVLLAAPARAQVRTNTADLPPVYPGAVQDRVADNPGARSADQGDLRATYEASYRASESIETVLRWYVQRLGAQRVEDLGPAAAPPSMLRPGARTPVGYEVSPEEFSDERVECDGAACAREPSYVRAGATKRATLTRARPPYQSGVWLRSAHIAYGVRRPTGDLVLSSITLEDIGLNERWTTWSAQTQLTIGVGTAPLDCSGDLIAELEQLCERERGERAGAMAATPASERHPGIRAYPGARFDAAASEGMSSQEERYFVYVTADSLPQVVRFYEQETGRPTTPMPDGSRVVVVRGALPWPDLSAMLQRNTMFPGPARTVITIRVKVEQR